MKLKKLICTCYTGSPVSQTEFNDLPLFAELKENEKLPYLIEITEVPDMNGDGAIDLSDIELLLKSDKNVLTALDGDGDFRSEESIAFLKEADIIVTNPPFSLFREYVSQLMEYNKKFIILGNNNAITYKEIFPLIKENKIWLGNNVNKTIEFRLSDNYKKWDRIDGGIKYGKVPAISWFTNLDINKRHEDLILYKKYSDEDFLPFDNYDAINIDRTSDIPCDYYQTMGVPITFLNIYNPDQFEIIGITKTPIGSHLRTKIYPQQVQIAKNGTRSKVMKLNDGPAIEINEIDKNKVCYEVDGKIYYAPYARILIRRKQ